MKTECSTTFEVNKTFRKKITLPPLSKWQVADDDSLMHGAVKSVIRTKGLVFKRTSENKPRYINITKQGFMIVYDGDDKGYVVDLTNALSVKTKSSKNLNHSMLVSVVVKMSYGSISMLPLEKEALLWMEAINAVVVGKKHSRSTYPKPTNMAAADNIEMDSSDASVRTLVAEEGVIASTSVDAVSSKTLVEESQEVSECFMPSSIVIPIDEDSKSKSPVTVIEVKPQPKVKVEVKPHPLPRMGVDAWRRPAVVLPPSTTSTTSEAETTASVRCGPESVATLRNKLESKSRCSWRKTRKQRRPTMLEHPLIPSEEMKTPRLLAQKSASAPALVPQHEKAAPSSSRRSVATISYDGCFDSIRA